MIKVEMKVAHIKMKNLNSKVIAKFYHCYVV